MTTQNLIREFLALPPEALPGVTGDDRQDSPGDLWAAARLMSCGRLAAGRCFSRTLILAADRDGWREGFEVAVE